MSAPTKRTIVAIDANSLIHRAYHALPPLTTPEGLPAQALYGVASILLKIWAIERPVYAAALFDRPEPTFRKKAYEAYKAHRPPAPDDLISQIIAAHDLFPQFGIPVFEAPGFEADDLIATLATRFGGQDDLEVVILTGDLDTLQLVSDGRVAVRVFRTGMSDTVIYDEAAVRARYGLEPNQLVDYKALVGDASDNVKGVSGVGPKTATVWLSEYGTLENLLKNVHDDPKLKRLIGREEEAKLSRSLVVLRTDAPFSVEDPEALVVHTNEAVLISYFEKLGFHSLVKRLTGGQFVEAKPKNPKSAPPQAALF